MDRSNHYEAAFEAYLQDHGHCYVAVDETRRSWMGDSRVKSLDFVVYGPQGARLVIDVKGRRFPGGKEGKWRRVWENWCNDEDVEGLERWTECFGPGYQGVFVFGYHLLPVVELADDTPDLYHWRGRRYLFRAIDVRIYRQHLQVRSPRWRTVCMPGAIFRQEVRPVREFLLAAPAYLEEVPF